MDSSSKIPHVARKNIEIIAQIEEELRQQRSWVERFGERIALFFGSLLFIAAHVVIMTAWILVNSRAIPSIDPFDPYPFPLLALVIGIEFIFLTTFVLINQNHEIRRTERWEHLHLQLSILTEQEITKNLEMLVLIARHLGLQDPREDQELQELTKTTSVSAVAGEIEKARR